jgi:hypothetical protein
MPSRKKKNANMQVCVFHLKCGDGGDELHSFPMGRFDAVAAASVGLHWCSTAETVVFLWYLIGRATSDRLRHLACDLSHLLVKATGVALRAIAFTAASVRVVAVIAASIASSTMTNRDGDALDDAIGRALTWSLSRVVSVIGREVPTDHVCLYSSAIASQLFRCIGDIGTVLAVVDADFAVEAVSVLVGFVVRIRPMTTLANAYSDAAASVIFLIQSRASSTVCTKMVGR